MQGVNTGESGVPNGEQGMRTQEIHIVSSNAHRQAYASMQNQRLQKQFEPMTFSNTPFPAEKEGHRRGKAESTPRWRFAFVASLIAIDLAVMLLSLTVSLVINGAAFDAIGDVMPFWLFLILFSLIWLLCLAFAGTDQSPCPTALCLPARTPPNTCSTPSTRTFLWHSRTNTSSTLPKR